jgi:hypothetical protein
MKACDEGLNEKSKRMGEITGNNKNNETSLQA